jgi:hypothetical protein
MGPTAITSCMRVPGFRNPLALLRPLGLMPGMHHLYTQGCLELAGPPLWRMCRPCGKDVQETHQPTHVHHFLRSSSAPPPACEQLLVHLVKHTWRRRCGHWTTTGQTVTFLDGAGRGSRHNTGRTLTLAFINGECWRSHVFYRAPPNCTYVQTA